MKVIRKRILALTVLAIGVMGPGSAIRASAVETTSGSGKLKQFQGVQASSGQNDCIEGNTGFDPDPYVDMPGMVLALSGTGPFVVLFKGQFYDPFISGGNGPGSRVAIVAEIDGVQVGSFFAIGNQLEAVGSSMQTFGFHAFSDKLGAGAHELKIRWRATLGARACVEERSLIVLEP